MSYIKFNPNPLGKNTGDCVIRAISIAEGKTWDQTFEEVTTKAFNEKDMPSINPIWTDYLIEHGYELVGIPSSCPRCYTVRDFAWDHPYGTYVLGTGSHAIAVIDGNYIDAWDSGDEVPMYFLRKGVIQNGNSELSATDTTDTKPVQPADNTTGTNTAANSAVQPATNSGSVLGTGAGGSQGVSS